jgi:carboxypeptidase family protein
MSSLPVFSRVVAVAVLVAVGAGCGEETPTSVDRRSPELHVSCLPINALVTCTATLSGVPGAGSNRDVTSKATWLVSDPSVGEFLEPGTLTPKRRGEVEISARFEAVTTRVSSWFLIDPLQPAQRLYFLSGIVRDDASNTPLAGAAVEILDGYARGSRSVTNQFGHYQIDRILTGEAFSAKASAPGYAPLTRSYRVDSPIGPPGNSPFLDFRLGRLE